MNDFHTAAASCFKAEGISFRSDSPSFRWLCCHGRSSFASAQQMVPHLEIGKMKRSMVKPFILFLLVAVFSAVLAGQASAQTFTNLYNFSGGSDGAKPQAPLISSGTKLYGTTFAGGSGNGTVFAVNVDGTGFTTLYSFSGSDGAGPHGAMVWSSNKLYGTTYAGGDNNLGTVFSIADDGTKFTTLHSFGGSSDGANPLGALVLSGNNLYGTALGGGASGIGTVFVIDADGTGFATLHSFNGSDGASPYGALVLLGNTLYGTTLDGGAFGNGAVFRTRTDGTAFTNLHNFTPTPSSINNDGAGPNGLMMSGNRLYGTAGSGGSSGFGVAFALNSDGTGFTVLHNFTGSDGGLPDSPLLLSGSTLYGAAIYGGNSGGGTIFSLNTNGTAFTNLYRFTAAVSCCPPVNNDGLNPHDGMVAVAGALYGETQEGGTSGYGTVFSISLPSAVSPPTLTIAPAAGNVVLSWPTTTIGFTLQSTTNLNSPRWTTNLPAPVVVNEQNTVTNPISGTQQFFRLSQ